MSTQPNATLAPYHTIFMTTFIHGSEFAVTDRHLHSKELSYDQRGPK